MFSKINEKGKENGQDADGMADVGGYLGCSIGYVSGGDCLMAYHQAGDVSLDESVFMVGDDALLKGVRLVQDKRWKFHGISYEMELRDVKRCLSDIDIIMCTATAQDLI